MLTTECIHIPSLCDREKYRVDTVKHALTIYLFLPLLPLPLLTFICTLILMCKKVSQCKSFVRLALGAVFLSVSP